MGRGNEIKSADRAVLAKIIAALCAISLRTNLFTGGIAVQNCKFSADIGYVSVDTT